MYCPKCTAKNKDDALICSNCGYAFELNKYRVQTHEPTNETTNKTTNEPTNEITNETTENSNEGCFGKISKIFSICGSIITLIFLLWACSLDKEDYVDLIQEFVPVYSMAIQNEVASQYNSSLTYGEAFERYFTKCNWSDETRNSEPIVKFTGIFDNGNNTYSKVQIIFAITELEDFGEFYYQIDTVIIDGIDMGWLGITALMSDIFSSVGV